MGRLDGKVAFITGAARGQGRSHAVRLAREGAAIIACDICAEIETVQYPLGTEEDLAETVRRVEAEDQRIVARKSDVRDPEHVRAALEAGLEAFGRVDIVVPNAGIAAQSASEADPAAVFADSIAVNLIGVRNSVQAAVPLLIDQGEGGAIVLTGSTLATNGAGGTGGGGMDGYVASKHGVVGLMRTWANWLAPHNIRVNAVCPTGVKTKMIENEVMEQFVAHFPQMPAAFTNLLAVDAIEPEDVSNAVAWLVSDEARYVTGVILPVDAGYSAK